MKLLYLYVERHRCLRGLSVNFSDEYRFRTSIEDMPCGTLAIYCDVNNDSALPKDFWSWHSVDKEVGEDRGVVESVSAIVGENGSGKTSIASAFYNVSNPIEDWQGRIPHYICIYKKAGKFICMHGQNWKLNVDSLPDEIKNNLEHQFCSQQALPFDFVYYSPYTTTESVIQSYQDSIIDISTGNIIRRVSDFDRTAKGSLFSEIAFLDYTKIFRFLYACRNGGNTLPKDLPMPLPVGVDVYANDRILDALKNRLLEQKNRWHYSLGATRVLRLAEGALKVAECNCFIPKMAGAFLCGIMLNDFDRVAAADDGELEEYSFFDKITSCVTRYMNLPNLIKDVPVPASGGHGTAKVVNWMHETIQSIISVFEDDESFSRFCNRNSLAKNEIVAIFRVLTEWYGKKYEGCSDLHFEYEKPPTFYIQNDDELNWVSSFTMHLHQIGRFNHFVEFSFPRMSSGEMAYLTMFGRLYSVFSGQVDEEYGETASEQEDVLLYLDEAETTLHPQWQRYLVLCIIWFLSRFANGKLIHVVFASHSPVLLSDIPKSNAIFLKKSPRSDFPTVVESACDIEINTFGNNIFDLYRYVFTRDKGAVGAFADTKLTMALKEVSRVVKYNSKGGKRKLSKKAEAILNLVGDCGIARYLEDLKAGGLV